MGRYGIAIRNLRKSSVRSLRQGYRSSPSIRKIENPKPQPKPKKRSRYKSQNELTIILEEILGCRCEPEKIFDWLISPKGAHLRVDIFFEKFNLAVEYHGQQHDQFPNAFHKTAEDFRYAAMCDAWKLKALKDRGITVIEFSYKDKLSKPLVMRRLKAAGVI